jgi:pimeloyl-ACP methyl ester carboxylesterase
VQRVWSDCKAYLYFIANEILVLISLIPLSFHQFPLELRTSWLGFYSALGYDVFMFNYRGYNDSTGTPSPSAAKSDAVVAYNYLKTSRRARDVIVHGESIGGMVACYVAKVCQTQLLVCDRTFCSLDAVASRMMGQVTATFVVGICLSLFLCVVAFAALRCLGLRSSRFYFYRPCLIIELVN